MRKIYFTINVFAVILLLYGCVPTKNTVKTQTEAQMDYLVINNELRTQRTKLDAVTEAISSTKELLGEWLSESTNYSEQRYDSLGRLISSIERTTTRNGGKEVAKQGDTYIYQGITIQQIDSIVSEQMKLLKSEMAATSKTMEKRGLAWWQSALIWVGALFLLLIVFGLIKRFAFKRR